MGNFQREIVLGGVGLVQVGISAPENCPVTLLRHFDSVQSFGVAFLLVVHSALSYCNFNSGSLVCGRRKGINVDFKSKCSVFILEVTGCINLVHFGSLTV